MNARQAACMLILVVGLSIVAANGGLSADAVPAAFAADGVVHPSLVIGAKLQCGIFNGQKLCLTGKQLQKILKSQSQSGQQKGGKSKNKDNDKNKGGSKGKNKGEDNAKDTGQQGSCPKGNILVQGPNGFSCEPDPALIPKQGETEVCCTIQVTEANGSPAPSPAFVQCRTTEAAAREAATVFANSNSFRVTSTSCESHVK